jgi:phosphomannomutase
LINNVYVFDVDGTITDSCTRMDPEFQTLFIEFCKQEDVYLITGSDRQKTFEQVGPTVYGLVKGVWQCNGNEYWENNKRVSKKDFKLDYETKHYLENIAHKSTYPGKKAGDHIERRTGMVNFSVVGRAATDQQRKDYFEWDCEVEERVDITDQINRKFKDLHASIGGLISIDIAPRGNNKSEAATVLKEKYKNIHFFGDRMEYGGNDYPLALVIDLGKLGKTYRVNSYKQTWEVLKQL